MPDVPPAHVGRGFLFKLSLVVALLILASSIVNPILSRFLQPTLASGTIPAQDAFEIFNLSLNLYSLGYVAVFILVFYFIGLRSTVIIERDWLALLEYLFLGALIGGFGAFLAVMGVYDALYGVSVGLDYYGVLGWFGNIVSFIRNGGQDALMAFAALVVGSLLRPPVVEETTPPSLEPEAVS